MTPERALYYIGDGKIISYLIVPSNQEWEAYSTPVKIPLRLGLFSHRLQLINRDKSLFLKSLKNLTAK